MFSIAYRGNLTHRAQKAHVAPSNDSRKTTAAIAEDLVYRPHSRDGEPSVRTSPYDP
jgi:hypothetical protein